MRKSQYATVERALIELSDATADLAKSANIAYSRMVLRSKLSAAIADAGKAERAAEALRTVASNDIRQLSKQDSCLTHEALNDAPGASGHLTRSRA